ncbi:ATP-binding protein [Rhodospirillaceae bacterium SYSU D60014]|uniref:sensor histidine kinase n=1 Tax=Virgifigura deserti TaxID=2268457 RepID=UPI000E6692D4
MISGDAQPSAAATARSWLLRFADWFIPGELRVDTGLFWQTRIFVISHLLSPFFAAGIIYYLYIADPDPHLPFWGLFLLASLFLPLPVVIKAFGRLTPVALFSLCNLTFLCVFGSFFYGGLSSPFLPWFLTALLIGFFYLGDRAFLVLGIFIVNLLGLALAYLFRGSFPEIVPVEMLAGVGVVSVCAATAYMSMMAVSYAYVISAQSELRKEIARHLVTSARMRQAKEEAERASENRSIFLAKMNHHFRTPLNAVIGYSELLLEEADADDEQEKVEVLNKIKISGRHLLSLVADVLDFAKVSSDEVEILDQEFSMDAFIDDIASTCSGLVEANGNRFIVEKKNALGQAMCDQTRLRQVIINLLSNAGKFTSNGSVFFEVARHPGPLSDVIKISVRDTGIGIAPENIEKVFASYNQAEPATASKYGGTGLGLALSRRLCLLMQGQITMESEIGRGSTFTVQIPIWRHSETGLSVEQDDAMPGRVQPA